MHKPNLKYELMYNPDQRQFVEHGRLTNNVLANIDDLDPQKYTAFQMRQVSLGRGPNPNFGNIDDLDPQKYTDEKLFDESIDRA